MRVLILFCVTGASAIAAEVVWVRLLQPVFGSTAEATAAVIALYLTGLAGGSFLFGRLAGRIEQPFRALVRLASAAGIVFAISPHALRLVGGIGGLGLPVAAGVLIILPTVLLGGMWPLVAETISPRAAGRGLGTLYLVHNLGGAVGGLVTGFLLMPRVGISWSLTLAGAGLFVAAAIGSSIARRAPEVVAAGSSREEHADPSVTSTVGLRRWAVAYGVAGLLFLGLEVTWTRLFSLFYQNSVYTFSAVLATYLAGVAIGAAAMARRSDRIRDPELAAGVALALTACLGLLPALAFGPMLRMQANVRGLPAFGSHGAALGADLLIAAIAVLPATMAMGALFPIVGRIVGAGRRSLGRAVGAIYGAATLGSILGGPLAAFLLIPLVGVRGSLLILSASVFLVGTWAVMSRGRREGSRGAMMIEVLFMVWVALAAVLGRTPPLEKAALRPGEWVVLHKEGRAAHAAVVIDADGHRRLRVNRSYSMGGDLGVRVEKRQGLLPVLVHPAPRRTLVLGLGTGVTVGAAASDPEGNVVCAEILPEVIALSKLFRGDHGGLEGHPRIRIVEADGRTFVRDSVERWDLIVSDLFFPWRHGVGPLYSREHFESARAALRPGGIYWQWFALHQLTREEVRVLSATFASVFPEVEIWLADLSAEVPVAGLVGSERPLALGIEDGIRRVGPTGLDPVGLSSAIDVLALRVAGSEAVRAFCQGATLHTDDRPVIEFTSPANFFEEPLGILRPNLEAFASLLEAPGGVGPRQPLGAIREAAGWCLRGEIARIDREPVEEMRAIFRALEILPELRRPREAILHRARTFLLASKPESALEILENLLRSFPDDPDARKLKEEALRASADGR